MSGCRRRAGDEKRFDEKMKRGCEGSEREDAVVSGMKGGKRGTGVARDGWRRRSGDEENLQDAGDAERVLSGTKKWLFLLECARCTCTFSRKTDGRGSGRGQAGGRSELTRGKEEDEKGYRDDRTRGGEGGSGGCGGRR